MSFVSYAQNFEDVLLWRALGHVDGGRYLDIGAQDPVVDSVSLAFYEAGWRGVHVEATPFFAGRLRDARPDEIVVEAAVSDCSGLIDFYEIVNTGLSTGRPDIAAKHVERGYAARQISVATIGLDQLLEKAGPVHWMKIDVEGMEPNVLASWRDNPVRPWIVLVEATFPLEQIPTEASWCAELSGRGYQEVFFDGLSRYFVHEAEKELADRFTSPPNVFDCYQVTARHFSTSQLVEEVSKEKDGWSERIRQSEAERGELAERLNAEIEALGNASEQQDLLQADLTRAEQDLRRAEQARLAADTLSHQLNDELATARREYEGLAQRLAQAESEHRQTLKSISTEHRAHERRIAGEAAATETRLLELIAEFQSQARERELAAAAVADRLAAAEKLIAEAIAMPPDRWQRLGRALRLSRSDRGRALLHSWQAQPRGGHPVQLSEQTMPTAQPQEPFSNLQANSLAELLSLDGSDFVQSAYATMLGREADPEGELYYGRRLAQGHSKLALLEQMRRSPEARLLPDTLPGLDDSFRSYRFHSLWRGKRKSGELVGKRIVDAAVTPHVDHFMRYHDEEFVRVVYLFYLGREPEPAGLQHHVDRIRQGVSRQQILINVAASQEARSHNRHAVGERALALALSIERIPVIGTLVALLKFESRIKDHLRDVRALQNHLYRISRKIA